MWRGAHVIRVRWPCITGAATGYLFSLATGECYGIKEALIDAALGASGAGLVAKLEKLRELSKLRALAKERGLVQNKITPQIEDYINPTNPIERLKIKLAPSLNAPGSLSQGTRVEYRVAPGTFQNPFTGAMGKTAEYSHVPFGVPSTAGMLAGGAAGGALGQGFCSCRQ